MIDPEARAGNPKENTASVSEEVNLPCHLLPELQLYRGQPVLTRGYSASIDCILEICENVTMSRAEILIHQDLNARSNSTITVNTVSIVSPSRPW